MSNDTVLDIKLINDIARDMFGAMASHQENQFARAIEQAVLQSPEVQALREDAARYQWLKANGSMSVDSFVDKYRVVDASISLVITDWMDSFDEAIDAAMEKQ